MPLLISLRGEFVKLAAADGKKRVYTPLAMRGIAWIPKMYCEGQSPLKFDRERDDIFWITW